MWCGVLCVYSGGYTTHMHSIHTLIAFKCSKAADFPKQSLYLINDYDDEDDGDDDCITCCKLGSLHLLATWSDL